MTHKVTLTDDDVIAIRIGLESLLDSFQFMRGFGKEKTSREIYTEMTLEKIRNIKTARITTRKGKHL